MYKDIGGEDKLLKFGWTNKTQRDRFTLTANMHRHPRPATVPPKPMSLPEGSGYLKGLVLRWVQVRGQSGGCIE